MDTKVKSILQLYPQQYTLQYQQLYTMARAVLGTIRAFVLLLLGVVLDLCTLSSTKERFCQKAATPCVIETKDVRTTEWIRYKGCHVRRTYMRKTNVCCKGFHGPDCDQLVYEWTDAPDSDAEDLHLPNFVSCETIDTLPRPVRACSVNLKSESIGILGESHTPKNVFITNDQRSTLYDKLQRLLFQNKKLQRGMQSKLTFKTQHK